MRKIILLLLFVLAFPRYGRAEEPRKEKKDLSTILSFDKGAENKDEPVVINSKEAVFDNKGLSATYTGDVKVAKGDMVLTADEVKSFFEKKSRKIQRIEANSNVRVVKGERVITAEKGTYYEADKRIELTGKPRIVQGDNILEGDSISFFILRDKVVIHGNVRTVFVPPSKKKGIDDKNAEDDSKKKSSKIENKPVSVFARELVLLKNEKTVDYSGDVRVENGDVRLFADKLHIILDGDKYDLESIIAKNRVRLVDSKRTIFAGMGEYDIRNERVYLSGSPKAVMGNSVLDGESIVCFLDEGRIVVNSAVSVLYPDEIEKSRKQMDK